MRDFVPRQLRSLVDLIWSTELENFRLANPTWEPLHLPHFIADKLLGAVLDSRFTHLESIFWIGESSSYAECQGASSGGRTTALSIPRLRSNWTPRSGTLETCRTLRLDGLQFIAPLGRVEVKWWSADGRSVARLLGSKMGIKIASKLGNAGNQSRLSEFGKNLNPVRTPISRT